MSTKRWVATAAVVAIVLAVAATVEPVWAQAQKQPMTAAERTQKLARWRVALDCATFHGNRMDRFEAQGNQKAAAEAEDLWADWDDLLIDIEDELKMPRAEEVEAGNKVEAAHKGQIAKGWPAYEKAWMGKCGKSPY